MKNRSSKMTAKELSALQFGERFKKVLADQEITQSQAAYVLGVGESFISVLCNGKRLPAFHSLQNIIRTFNLRPHMVHWLITGESQR